MYKFCYYFIMFFIYSCLGWVVESIACSKIEKRIVLNRGFLIGPYIPIYGTAALVMTFFLTEYKNDLFVLFCMAVIYASILEYATSYFMEKIFSAKWWSYEHEKLNLNGRICLKDSLLFGVLGCFVIHVTNPLIKEFLNKAPSQILIPVAWIIFTIFLCDFFLTIWILSKLKLQALKLKGDATEEIDRAAKQLLSHYKFLYRRLFSAFPKIQFTTRKGDILVKKVRKKFEEMDRFLTEQKKEISKLKTKIHTLKDNAASPEKIQEYKKKIKEIRKKKIR